MLFDPTTGKVIEENVDADAAQQGQQGFMQGMEPAAIRSIMRAPTKVAMPMGDDEGEVFRGQGGRSHDPRDSQDGGWEPINSGDIHSLSRLGYRG